MKYKLFIMLFFLFPGFVVLSQTSSDSIAKTPGYIAADSLKIKPTDALLNQEKSGVADDPSNLLTRIEFFNTLKHNNNGIYLNSTTLRSILQFRKNFTTRIDMPLVYNSFSKTGSKQYGLGDISIRLLGYRIFANKKSTLIANIELSFNTATSPLLGTGKNVILPVISYSYLIKNKGVFSLLFQQANSMWGDKNRAKINFSKFQAILITYWSKKVWTVLSPELFIDYTNKADVSMNLRGRVTVAPVPLINIWADAGTGLFGNFIDRYQWTTELGFRYFIFRKNLLKKRAGKSLI